MTTRVRSSMCGRLHGKIYYTCNKCVCSRLHGKLCCTSNKCVCGRLHDKLCYTCNKCVCDRLHGKLCYRPTCNKCVCGRLHGRCARKAEWYFRRAFFRSLVTVGGCTLKKEDARGTTINKAAFIYREQVNKLQYSLKSVSYQCARGKSFIARKPEVHPETFKW